jgi:hypothetical protein
MCTEDDACSKVESRGDPAPGGADNDAPWQGAEGDNPQLPAVIMLSWLRLLREDLARVLFCIVDASWKCSGTRRLPSLGGKAGNALAEKSDSTSSYPAVVLDDLPLSAMH